MPVTLTIKQVPDELAARLRMLAARHPVQAMDAVLMLEALQLRERYPLSHWDAAILCAAQRMGARILISEDMNHGQVFGMVQVRNPFVA